MSTRTPLTGMRTIVMVSGLLVLLMAGTAQAQSTKRPWVAAGLGSGTYSLDGGRGDRGRFGYVGLRLPITQTFLLGVEASLLSQGHNSTHAVFNGMAYFYPSATGGLFLKAGLGLARLNRPTYGSESASALVWGLGYDIRVSKKASLTPFLDGGLQATNTWRQFGLAVSFH